MTNRWWITAAGCLAVLVSAGCEPWGKPDQPEVPASEIRDFKTLFGQNCAGCHGAEGRQGPGRILNDHLYLKLLPREELHKVLVYGRPGTAMPPWLLANGGPLNEQQIDALVDGIYQHWSGPIDLHGTELPSYAGDVNGDITHGKKLFTKDCYMCHGPGAAVGLVTSASYLQLVSNQMIRTSIIVGRPDLTIKMPSYMYLNAGHALSNQDVTDLVSYLASLRPPSPVLEGEHTDENESGTSTPGAAAGSKGSGNGPGAPNHDQIQGNSHGNSSQSGGTIEQRKPQH